MMTHVQPPLMLIISHLSHWLMISADRGIVTGVPLESERIEVQPGDVVGFYLDSFRSKGIQFAGDFDNTSLYTEETAWFATGSLTPRPEATSMFLT